MSKAISWLSTMMKDQMIHEPNHFFGYDWYQITDEEMAVFQLRPEEMSWLVEVSDAYSAIKDVSHNDIHGNKELCSAVRKDLNIKPDRCFSLNEFSEFAKHFGVSYRNSKAIYWKMDFWCVRNGITTYSDEKQF